MAEVEVAEEVVDLDVDVRGEWGVGEEVVAVEVDVVKVGFGV